MLATLKSAVRAGITTTELDEIGAGVMRQYSARSAPALVYKFPGMNCISVNEEVVHGIPGARCLCEGDLVNLDVTIEKTVSWPTRQLPLPWAMRPMKTDAY
jgi:methionyl aminopeptidase